MNSMYVSLTYKYRILNRAICPGPLYVTPLPPSLPPSYPQCRLLQAGSELFFVGGDVLPRGCPEQVPYVRGAAVPDEGQGWGEGGREGGRERMVGGGRSKWLSKSSSSPWSRNEGNEGGERMAEIKRRDSTHTHTHR